jgi:hypothetical protein
MACCTKGDEFAPSGTSFLTASFTSFGDGTSPSLRWKARSSATASSCCTVTLSGVTLKIFTRGRPRAVAPYLKLSFSGWAVSCFSTMDLMRSGACKGDKGTPNGRNTHRNDMLHTGQVAVRKQQDDQQSPYITTPFPLPQWHQENVP